MKVSYKDLNLGDMTKEQFDETIKSLIDKGLVQAVPDNGDITYVLTPMGEMVGDALAAPEDCN